jgi:hypothetical protein
MKNSLFANALVVLIGVLMLIAAMQLLGWGQGTSSLEPEPFDASKLSQLEETTVSVDAKAAEELVGQINSAPLFNADRKPYVADSTEDEVLVVEEIEAEPLKAKVTSIMIYGENKYAMLLDQLTNEQLTLQQGMPLPGEQGLWVVDNIEPRQVTFVSEGKEPVSLELEVFDGTLNSKAAKVNNRRGGNGRNRNDSEEADEKPADNAAAQKNSAEEIRKKIAERRAQMRANAAKGQQNDK